MFHSPILFCLAMTRESNLKDLSMYYRRLHTACSRPCSAGRWSAAVSCPEQPAAPSLSSAAGTPSLDTAPCCSPDSPGPNATATDTQSYHNAPCTETNVLDCLDN